MAQSEYDIPLNDWGYDNTPYVTIEEMKEILDKKKTPWGDAYEDLQLDEQTGLYYTTYFEEYPSDIVYAHWLVERMMEMSEKVDWARVTFGYTTSIIDNLEEIYQHPLVWIEGENHELEDKYLVIGRVAKPMSSEERCTCSPDDTFFIEMMEYERTLWFADNLPIAPKHSREEGFIRWDLITESVVASHWPDGRFGTHLLNVNEFRQKIDYIATHRGGAKAAEIIQLFRQDWPEIVALKLFEIEKFTPQQIEEFRLTLFEGMDRKMRQWESEVPKPQEQTQKTSKEPSSQDLENTFSFVFRRTDDYRRMIDFLIAERNTASDGDWARYALAMYEANIFIHRPKTFKTWLPRFCEIFGRTVPYQEPNKLKRTQCERSIEAFLPAH